jgi:hypothetical protein
MAIVRHNGKIITRDGTIGTGQGCCCATCDPCSNGGGVEIQFPASRLVGTWVGSQGGNPTAFDWLAPADQGLAGNWPPHLLNAYWTNQSRSGGSASAPDTSVHATVWRWDGSTETCYTYDENGDAVEAEVPALRTCGDDACSAWFYGEQGSVNAIMGGQEYRTLIANPPPDDNQWYTFLYIESGFGGPEVRYWAWIPYCTQTCGEVALSSDGPFPQTLDIETFTLTCALGNACCSGNDAYPVFKMDSECDGHNNVDYSAQQSASQPPPCLGACCYNDGTNDVCGGPMSKSQCDALSGVWHSGKSCDPDQQLITLSFSSAQFGSGGGGIATAPVGTPGPITAVSITNPGSGYARVVRVVPSVAASVAGGAGATFTSNMVSNGGSPQTWRVGSVTIAGNGTGYTDGAAVAFTTADVAQTAAVATLRTVRSQPTLTASVSGGTGATLTPTLASNGDSPQTWGVSSVAVTGTTSGYTDGAAVTFSYGAGVNEQTKATAEIRTARTAPTITASAPGGSGAALAVTLSQSPTTPSDTALWHVESVEVTDGGSGYTDGDSVTFAVTDGTQVVAAAGTITTTVRENPNLTAYVWGLSEPTGGSGAVLSATMEYVQYASEDFWTVAGIAVTSGGSGYSVGEYIWYEELPNFSDNPPYYLVFYDSWVVTSVDENGAITGLGTQVPLEEYGGGLFYKLTDNGTIQSVTLTSGGDYYKATGEISRVVVTNGGQYFYDTGVPSSVTVTNGGQYYREEVQVAQVAVTINQINFPYGTGASITATVDGNKVSATFGQVTGLTIANGGSGYVAVRPADDPCNLFP